MPHPLDGFPVYTIFKSVCRASSNVDRSVARLKLDLKRVIRKICIKMGREEENSKHNSLDIQYLLPGPSSQSIYLVHSKMHPKALRSTFSPVTPRHRPVLAWYDSRPRHSAPSPPITIRSTILGDPRHADARLMPAVLKKPIRFCRRRCLHAVTRAL